MDAWVELAKLLKIPLRLGAEIPLDVFEAAFADFFLVGEEFLALKELDEVNPNIVGDLVSESSSPVSCSLSICI